MRDISAFLDQFNHWVSGEPAISAALLVGSFARGTAHDASDIDLVLITQNPSVYLHNRDWISLFGRTVQTAVEDWGLLQSIRVFYENGMEVEFGLTTPQWAAIDPVDEGTQQVILDGAHILLDRDGQMAALLAMVHAQRKKT